MATYDTFRTFSVNSQVGFTEQFAKKMHKRPPEPWCVRNRQNINACHSTRKQIHSGTNALINRSTDLPSFFSGSKKISKFSILYKCTDILTGLKILKQTSLWQNPELIILYNASNYRSCRQ